MRILVLAAHPDDEVLGCGGTIARLAREDHDVAIAILGEGATSRHARRDDASTAEVAALRADSAAAARILGARSVHHEGLPDNRFDTLALLDIVKTVEAIVEQERPAVIFTQHGGDLNIDHQLLYRATLTATRPVPGSSVHRVFAYPVGSSSEWAFNHLAPTFQPTTFIDISATLNDKIQALAAYEDEIRPFPHPRSPEALQATARHWGSAAGFSAAEPFETVRQNIPEGATL